MSHYRHKQVKLALERIPRGSIEQNMFRQDFEVHLMMGDSFEVGMKKACTNTRRLYHPNFVPCVLPPKESVSVSN